MVAIAEVTKQVMKKNPDFFPIKPMDYGRFLVISLGTGAEKNDHKFNANIAAKWGIFGWLFNNGTTPLITAYGQASADMVDFHNCVVFQALHSEDNYLRIQVNFDYNSFPFDLSISFAISISRASEIILLFY